MGSVTGVTPALVAHELAHVFASIFVLQNPVSIISTKDGGLRVEFDPPLYPSLAREAPDKFIGIVSAGHLFDLWHRKLIDLERDNCGTLLREIKRHYPIDGDEGLEPSDTFLIGYAARHASLHQIKRGLNIGRVCAAEIAEHFLLHPTRFESFARSFDEYDMLAVHSFDLLDALHYDGVGLRVVPAVRATLAG